MGALFAEAGLVGFAIGLPFSGMASSLSDAPAAAAAVSVVGTLVSVTITLVLFPLFLLSAMAADSAWLPLALPKVMRTMSRHWQPWCLFYLLAGGVTGVWLVATVVSGVLSF